MNSDRIIRLEELGFTWKLRYGRPKKHEERFRNKSLGIGYDDKPDEKDGSKCDNSTEEVTKTDAAEEEEEGEDNSESNYTEEVTSMDKSEEEREKDNQENTSLNEIFNLATPKIPTTEHNFGVE
eukprot:6351216-Ditylum_brightwellii.AAC.1